jgi:hypothetical protein
VGSALLWRVAEFWRKAIERMSPQEAIASSREARRMPTASWPVPLLRFLDQPPDDQRMFDWLCSAVGNLLTHFDRAMPELDEAVGFACRAATEAISTEQVEQRAMSLWLRRGDGLHFTAVAQLLFALSRGDRAQRHMLAGASATPILLLEELEPRDGEFFNRVIQHFTRYIDDGNLR